MENKSIGGAFLWSSFAEIAAKLISPITNMLLARILAPEAFGVLAVCNMIVSFVEIITDAGFGKYLIQHDFEDEHAFKRCVNVAFWTNFALSCVLWLLIFAFRGRIADFLGNAQYASVISIASLHLFFASMSSIQTSVLRRKFSFKLLFLVRICVAAIPLVVTIPLAIILRSYWALIIGNISGACVNTLLLLVCSRWLPRLEYSFKILHDMLSFSMWSLAEAMAHWMIFWVDTFIAGKMYTEYYVGLYKNSANAIMSVFNMITAAVTPVLMSSLSRMKEQEDDAFQFFLNIEKLAAYLLIPMGIGVFFFRKQITIILLGEQWIEATDIIGVWALLMTVSILFYALPAEVYKAKGVPKYLFGMQISHLLILIPVCYISAKNGFQYFYCARGICVVDLALKSLLFMRKYFSWQPLSFIKNLLFPLISGGWVGICCMLLYREEMGILSAIVRIAVVVVLYLVMVRCVLFKEVRSSLEEVRSRRI